MKQNQHKLSLVRKLGLEISLGLDFLKASSKGLIPFRASTGLWLGLEIFLGLACSLKSDSIKA
jgi:hypothetical protein